MKPVRLITLQRQQRNTTESNQKAKALRKEIKRKSYKRHQTNDDDDDDDTTTTTTTTNNNNIM